MANAHGLTFSTADEATLILSSAPGIDTPCLISDFKSTSEGRQICKPGPSEFTPSWVSFLLRHAGCSVKRRSGCLQTFSVCSCLMLRWLQSFVDQSWPHNVSKLRHTCYQSSHLPFCCLSPPPLHFLNVREHVRSTSQQGDPVSSRDHHKPAVNQCS